MSRRLHLASVVLLSVLSSVFGSEDHSGVNKNVFVSSEIKADDLNCDRQLHLLREALSAQEEWALRLFDMWGKVQSGVYHGNQNSFGSFQECLSYRHDLKSFDSEIIQGQYCLMRITATPNSAISDEIIDVFGWGDVGSLIRNKSLTVFNGICLPATCSQQKIINFTNEFLKQHELISTEAIGCQTSDTNRIEVIDIITITIFSIFGFLVIASTVYDLIMKQKDAEANKLLISFSAYTNGKELFDLKKSKSQNSINCLIGLRSMSLLWIMFGHRFYLTQLYAVTNPQAIANHYNHIYSVLQTSYGLAVDTFFVMGALLVTMSTLNALDKKILNIPRMILHRYIRYTPVLAVVVLYMVSLNKFAQNGPRISIDETSNCKKYWWSALLHVQNYVNPNARCLPHVWYLSADFQLFIISPFLIIPAWKYGWKYLWSLPLLALLSSVYVLIISLAYEIPAYTTTSEQSRNRNKWVYLPTHGRLGPWMLGIVLGYILHQTKGQTISINRKINSALWILSISVLTVVAIGIQPLRAPGNQTSLLINAFYVAFHRLAWALAIFWIIFACEKLKTGGIIRWFLSLPEWQPIAKVSLSMYLIHFIYQFATMTRQKQPFTYEIFPLLHIYCGDILAVFFLGSIAYLAFEAPLLLVEKYFYNKRNGGGNILSK